MCSVVQWFGTIQQHNTRRWIDIFGKRNLQTMCATMSMHCCNGWFRFFGRALTPHHMVRARALALRHQVNDRASEHILHVFAITHVVEACQLMHTLCLCARRMMPFRCSDESEKHKHINIPFKMVCAVVLIRLISMIFIIKIVLQSLGPYACQSMGITHKMAMTASRRQQQQRRSYLYG